MSPLIASEKLIVQLLSLSCNKIHISFSKSPKCFQGRKKKGEGGEEIENKSNKQKKKKKRQENSSGCLEPNRNERSHQEGKHIYPI